MGKNMNQEELNKWLDEEMQKALKGTTAYQLEQLQKAFKNLYIAIVETIKEHQLIFALWFIGLIYILIFF